MVSGRSKQASIYTCMHNAVTLVWGLTRLTSIISSNQADGVHACMKWSSLHQMVQLLLLSITACHYTSTIKEVAIHLHNNIMGTRVQSPCMPRLHRIKVTKHLGLFVGVGMRGRDIVTRQSNY